MDAQLFKELNAAPPEERRREIIEIIETLQLFADGSCPLNSALRCPLAGPCQECSKRN
jgi:hypothetical protein